MDALDALCCRCWIHQLARRFRRAAPGQSVGAGHPLRPGRADRADCSDQDRNVARAVAVLGLARSPARPRERVVRTTPSCMQLGVILSPDICAIFIQSLRHGPVSLRFFDYKESTMGFRNKKCEGGDNLWTLFTSESCWCFLAYRGDLSSSVSGCRRNI